MGHISDISGSYGGERQMQTAIVTAAKKVYPFLSLNDNYKLREEESETKQRLTELEELVKELLWVKELKRELQNKKS